MTDAYSPQQLNAQFAEHFGHSAEAVAHAPGRVNLIGEHTDYNQGFVLPAAINLGTWVVFRAHNQPWLDVVASDFDHQRVRVPLSAEQSLDDSAPWSDYLRGILVALLARGYRLAGGELLIAGNIPNGAGLSSSASLEMALIRALLALSGEDIDPTIAALVGQAAENDFVGCACGIMDQLISALGEQNSALLIDCQDLSTQSIAMPEDWALLIVHSGVRRGLVESEYNRRREQCEAGAAHFGKESLRAVTLTELQSAESALPEDVFKRCRHVLTENARTLEAADAMRVGDLQRLAPIMAASHASMRDDFAITTPAIDTLVELLSESAHGKAGVRMTGGGFGGCVVAVAPESVVPQMMTAVQDQYQEMTGCEPMLIKARASAGAFSQPIKKLAATNA